MTPHSVFSVPWRLCSLTERFIRRAELNRVLSGKWIREDEESIDVVKYMGDVLNGKYTSGGMVVGRVRDRTIEIKSII